jgi:hypothetical protein
MIKESIELRSNNHSLVKSNGENSEKGEKNERNGVEDWGRNKIRIGKIAERKVLKKSVCEEKEERTLEEIKSQNHSKDNSKGVQRKKMKRIKVSFVDQAQGAPLTEIHFVESYKKYNADPTANCHCNLL